MKHYIVLLLAGLLVTTGRGAAAQEPLAPPPLPDPGDLPPIVTELPGADAPSIDSVGEPIETGKLEVLDESGFLAERVFDMKPALLESSGTWLRRGFWYSEADAMLLGREFNRNGMILIEQLTNVTNASIGFSGLQSNQLLVRRSRPGLEGLPRLTVGRFLFRDPNNRDHALEVTAFGGGQWSQEQTVDTDPDILVGGLPTSLQVPDQLDLGNPSFDGAASSSFDYSSRFNSFEVNYRIKGRMSRDQMQMTPGGEWIRRASPSSTRSLFAGLRYFDLTENLDWQSRDVPVTLGPDAGMGITNDGVYNIRTDNDMIGTQLGFGVGYETARWAIEWVAKGGGYWNFITVDSVLTGSNNGGGMTRDIDGDNLAFVGESSVRFKWHIKQNLSLRLGMEVLYANAMALAPFQIDFSTADGPGTLRSGQDSVYLGTSIGVEGYW